MRSRRASPESVDTQRLPAEASHTLAISRSVFSASRLGTGPALRRLPRGDLGRREGLDPGGQHPLVAERIAEAAAALAVEVVGERVDDLGARANGTIPRGVDV